MRILTVLSLIGILLLVGCSGPNSAEAGSSDKDLEQKLRTVAAAWNSRHDVRPLIDAVWSLDQSADVSRLASLAVPAVHL